MKLNLLLILQLICFGSIAQSQLQKFEPGKISDGGVFGLTVSPDSKTSLWVKSNGRRDTLLIMEATLNKGSWSNPVVASFSDDAAKWKDIDPMFSPDGKMVLFQSTRPVPGRPERKGFDIWAVRREKNSWSEPFHLGNKINGDGSESYASMTAKGDIYFMKDNESKPGNSDIFVSRFIDGQYQVPQNIGLPVNTSFRESNPFISPEEDFLIYFSDDSTGIGEVDLYISFRSGSSWTKPKTIGAPVNSKFAEFCPFYHRHQKRLYFSRQEKATGRMYEDIYFMDVDIESFRDK
ncbi:hypothetical protein [Pollutibacter soli]|uniref:hypothetical protein n=1 Tax=Pollutibacter soli TaxID=3034157 RepID=UPI0030132637